MSTIRFTTSLFAIVAALAAPLPAGAQASFTPLGTLPGASNCFAGGSTGQGQNISGDGTTVVGRCPLPDRAFRWTAATGMLLLDPSLVLFPNDATGVSYDGSVVYGYGQNPATSGQTHAFRWMLGSGTTFLPVGAPRRTDFIRSSAAWDGSGDGSTVVGSRSTDKMDGFLPLDEAFTWTAATGMVGLGNILADCSSLPTTTHAFSTSEDGSVVVGVAAACSAVPSVAWRCGSPTQRCTSTTGLVSLGFQAYSFGSTARAVSADGIAIVGDSRNPTLLGGAFLWKQQSGMIGLGRPPGVNTGSFVAFDVAAGGCTVVGNGGNTGFIWDPVNGMRDLQTVLVSLGVNLSGFQINSAHGVSDDGTAIAGDVRNLTLNRHEPYRATIPNPVCVVCGDGVVGGSEECDDGNDLTGDGCRPDCTEELCGDGTLDPQEECDDGNAIDGDGCQANCALPVCGDGVVDLGLGEQCDDGNLIGADGCSETCHLEVCGNGTVDPAEECDDANGLIGDGCRPDCTQELCGDGTLDPQEQCDDTNNAPGDGCRADCTTELCGDGTLDPQEQCDDGNTTSGDGCQARCVLPVCGDAVVDAGEQCDDGNASSGDGCSASCQVEVCGNGILDPLEQCDDGNLGAGDGCRGDCTIESCGDGTLDPQEQCDDGNLADGDGCSGACEIETTSGGQGCTPGYWKNHDDSWPAPYNPETLFDDVFENAFPNQSLVQVLRRTGGGLDALGRHAVAALLNAASSEVSYDLTAPDVIQMFDQTHPGTKDAYNTLKDNFASLNESLNELGEHNCPLN